MSQTESQDVVASLLTWVVTVISFVLSNSITLFVYSYNNYPEFTKVAILLIGGYLLYKFSVKIFKIWLRIVISVVKSLVIFGTILIAFLLYLRGWDRLINQDLPYVKILIENFYYNKNDSTSGGLLSFLLSNPNLLNKENIKTTFNNFGNEDANSYFDYFDKNFDSSSGEKEPYERIQQLLHQGIEQLESSGVNWRELGNDMLDLLNNRHN